jgi:ribonuclease R
MTSRTAHTSDSAIERALLRRLGAPDYRPVPQRLLLHRLHVRPRERPRVRRVLQRLLDDGRVRKIRGGRLVAAPGGQEVRGLLERGRSGRARLVPDAGGDEIVVPARNLAHARPGDRVIVRVVSRGRDGRPRGVVARVLEARGGELLGLYRQRARGGVVRPFDSALGRAIHVPAACRGDAEDLHAVRFEMVQRPARAGGREARVLGTLGHLDAPGTDVSVVVRKFGLVTEFPAAVSAAAADLPTAVRREDRAGRERFAAPPAVTIDGETARDFDDAVAVEELPDGWRLFVHIADVAHFVPPGSSLDDEARRRATSVYFPDRVLPMFPEKLSNDLCSLRPGRDRLVQTVILDLSPSGAPRRVRFADGVVRSAARLTYAQVAELLEDKGRVRGVPARVVPMLRAADRLREVLERRRRRRGSIDFDFPEPQILLDVQGEMTGIALEPRNRAQLMIEEFMLAANEAVAAYLARRAAPCLYRVHEPPDPTSVAALESFVRGLGFALDVQDDQVTPGQIRRLLDTVAGRPEARMIEQVTLRAMQQARYAVANTGHFGLAAPVYCHFTSPIRRYPDLFVHRQLRRARARRRADADPSAAGLEEVARTCSERERDAEAAERELLLWKKLAFIEDKVGETFEGVITGVARFGLFVQLVDNLVEGLLRVETLGPEWFSFDEARLELRGAESGRTYRLGARLPVHVARVDRVLRRVDLALVGVADPAGRHGRPRRGSQRR